MPQDTPYDLAVIGSGPAGLMAAIAASAHGARVCVLEKMPYPARKLLATGGGHCNITNAASNDAFMRAFGRQGRFMDPALQLFGREALIAFFEKEGVPIHAPDGVQFFPESRSAADVLDVLMRVCERQGVRLLCSATVARIVANQETHPADGEDTNTPCFRVISAQGSTLITARKMVIATGGRGYPALGGDGSGHDIARQLGHTIRDPLPGLVGLRTEETWPHELAGVVINPAELSIDLPRLRKEVHTGPLLFTHVGISGIPAIDLSATISEHLQKQPSVPLRINLCPGMDAAYWEQKWNDLRRHDGTRKISNVLRELLPSSLVERILSQCAIGVNALVSRWTSEKQRALIAALTQLPLSIVGTDGFDKAMVTRGGVNLKEVDPRTLGSRLVPGISFAGEVLDLDGPCGGFNLQWAFSSGFLAGTTAISESEQEANA